MGFKFERLQDPENDILWFDADLFLEVEPGKAPDIAWPTGLSTENPLVSGHSCESLLTLLRNTDGTHVTRVPRFAESITMRAPSNGTK